MSNNRAGDAVGGPLRNGWLSSLPSLPLLRLLVLFGVLLAGDIAAQLAGIWMIGRAPASGAGWISLGAALVLAVLVIRDGRWIPMRHQRLPVPAK